MKGSGQIVMTANGRRLVEGEMRFVLYHEDKARKWEKFAGHEQRTVSVNKSFASLP